MIFQVVCPKFVADASRLSIHSSSGVDEYLMLWLSVPIREISLLRSADFPFLSHYP